ncbi:hypothetical protein APT79_13745 [Enterobacter sp. K66-74]|nr:hypothetical protein APT79_13745 [Enterobacter sp. K66-74]OJX62151.1 MAG: hypothetical protein BGO85_12080 [Enterobacter sp. 56-7]BBZ88180.1 hypothetical protein EAA2563_27950 [Enterobacter asburiae]BCP70731.1 hypothetical protein R1N_29180 [Enterobacter asburiae]
MQLIIRQQLFAVNVDADIAVKTFMLKPLRKYRAGFNYRQVLWYPRNALNFDYQHTGKTPLW